MTEWFQDTRTRLLVAMCAGLFGTACAPTYISGRISALSHSSLPTEASFAVLGSQVPTITERHIQDLIRAEMVGRGYQDSLSPNDATLAIVYAYSIGDGRTVVSSVPDNVFGGQKVTSSTSFPRYFLLWIVDLDAYRDQDRIVVLWQAELASEGSSRDMSWLADHFVHQIFERLGEDAMNERFLVPTVAPLL